MISLEFPIGKRSRAASSVFDKIKATDMVKFLHLNSIRTDKDKENFDFDMLDNYVVESRRRTTVRK